MTDDPINLAAHRKKRGLPPSITPTGPHYVGVWHFQGNVFLGTLLSRNELAKALERQDTFLYNAALTEALARDDTSPLCGGDNDNDETEDDIPPRYEPYTIGNHAIITCSDGLSLALRTTSRPVTIRHKSSSGWDILELTPPASALGLFLTMLTRLSETHTPPSAL
jgi:hypothetical protein